jgi:hypothetical protein
MHCVAGIGAPKKYQVAATRARKIWRYGHKDSLTAYGRDARICAPLIVRFVTGFKLR